MGFHALYNFKLRNYCTTLKQLVLDTDWAHVYFLSCKQKAPENFDRFGGFTFSCENIYSSVSFSINRIATAWQFCAGKENATGQVEGLNFKAVLRIAENARYFQSAWHFYIVKASIMKIG